MSMAKSGTQMSRATLIYMCWSPQIMRLVDTITNTFNRPKDQPHTYDILLPSSRHQIVNRRVNISHPLYRTYIGLLVLVHPVADQRLHHIRVTAFGRED